MLVEKSTFYQFFFILMQFFGFYCTIYVVLAYPPSTASHMFLNMFFSANVRNFVMSSAFKYDHIQCAK